MPASNSEVPLSEFLFQKLEAKTQLTTFDCGDPDLNDFLQNEAFDYQAQLLAVTYTFSAVDGQPIAFFSVANDALKDQDFEKWNNLSRKIPNRKRRKDYPALKIARLGVDVSLRGKMIGTKILTFIKIWFLNDNKTGCRFLLVDAYNKPEILSFYQSNGFIQLTDKDAKNKTRLMYFDLTRMLAEE